MISSWLYPAALSLAVVFTMVGLPSRAAAADSETPQYYEVRVYHAKSVEQQQRVSDYWQNAAIPAYNRQGISPIGVFTEQADSATNSIY